ncbi:acetylserotonin O-methyltransferase [Sinocyclocheilus rhinocerous]|uniref:Acetylserotonin O-methyltransferase n=1 Tax=Sinocyclocheilus rhinocerous TaxID=307959 RepID=A0A673KSD0_9TELE|nr:PREDICTED: acetylserotonin O-methyltransferase [Sinocyclocheilus rhinocerous]
MAGEEPYPRKILQYMEGFLVSKTLFCACELGVFERLQGSQSSASDLALALGCSEDGIERLLNSCVSLELLTANTDPHGTVLYSNTDMSSMFLIKSSPRSLCQSIEYSSRTIYLCWHYLSDAVREGKNQYEKAFGVNSKDLFEAMYRSDEEMVKFMHLMNSIWNICGRDVITAFDLSPFRCICDLGGCSGALAKQCVSAFPESTVTIFDLPKVVRTSQQHFVSNQDERICFCEGDFFKDELPQADLYILARILHDWTDQRSVELLTKIYQSCRTGGGVLLVEALLYEDNSGPLTAQLYSLNMLVQTEGRERKASDYSRLLRAAGFTHIQIHNTCKIYDAILARK